MRAAATDKHGQESEFMDYVCLRKEDIVDMVIRNVRLTEASAPAPASVSLQSEPAALVPDQVAGFTFHGKQQFLDRLKGVDTSCSGSSSSTLHLYLVFITNGKQKVMKLRATVFQREPRGSRLPLGRRGRHLPRLFRETSLIVFEMR